MNNTQKLIKKTEYEVWEEPVYADFVSREEFINRTGVFVTPQYFRGIYDKFKDKKIPAGEFVRDYVKKYATCLQEIPVRSRPFIYEVDDSDITAIGCYKDVMCELTVWDLMNNLVKAYEAEKTEKTELYEDLKDSVEMQLDKMNECRDLRLALSHIAEMCVRYACSVDKGAEAYVYN